MKTLIKNATIINEGQSFVGSVVIVNDIIEQVLSNEPSGDFDRIIDATGLMLDRKSVV